MQKCIYIRKKQDVVIWKFTCLDRRTAYSGDKLEVTYSYLKEGLFGAERRKLVFEEDFCDEFKLTDRMVEIQYKKIESRS